MDLLPRPTTKQKSRIPISQAESKITCKIGFKTGLAFFDDFAHEKDIAYVQYDRILYYAGNRTAIKLRAVSSSSDQAKLFAVACTLFAQAFVAQFASCWLCCATIIIGCRPIRAIATEVPSIFAFSASVSHQLYTSFLGFCQ